MALLQEHYPALKPLTVEELQAMTPDRATALLGELNKTAQQVNTTLVQLETQATAVDEQIAEITAQVKTEFNVDTREALEELQARAITQVQDTFTKLGALNLDA